MIGQTISHYKILEKLGEGGMGVVYKAEDTKLDRLVALKFLPSHLASDEKDKQRFIHEAKAASALDHPNICNVHEIGEIGDGQLFIAMALYDGEPFSKKIEKAPLKIEDALDVAIQVAEGLQAAHEKGITHRDIKSSNIMVTDKGRAVIMDFGLARTIGAAKLTKSGATVGTVPYMSPEQARGEKVDHRTDIWSFGVVLYEMITGQLPFKSEYHEAVVYSILNESPPPVTGLRTGVPVELERIINKCLEKKASDRYQHVDELMVDLRKVSRPTVPQPMIPKKGLKVVWAGVSIILLALIGTYFLLSPKEEAPTIESLAVLPLKNLMGDTEQDYFVEGMHEALTAELSKIAALKVISRTSAMRYKGTDKPTPQIARELGVRGLIEGSVLRDGDQVRITVQLIHGPSDKHLWAESYQRELSGILALQSEVARAIAREIRMTVTPAEATRLARTRPVNPEVYELYLKGIFLRNTMSKVSVRRAIEYFEEAIERDPSYAPAYAGLSTSYSTLVWVHASVPPTPEIRSKAKEAAFKALELDESLAEAHIALAAVNRIFEWDWDGAERAFKRAIELDPSNSEHRMYYANHLLSLGRLEQAIAVNRRTVELDPVSPSAYAELGFALRVSNRTEEAREQVLKALELEPDCRPCLNQLALILLRNGDHTQAVATAERAARDLPAYKGWLGYIYGAAGRRTEALGILSELQELTETEYVRLREFAWVYLGLGEKEKALQWLEEAYAEHDIFLVWLKVSPLFDPLRDDPRFQKLLRRMNFPNAVETKR